jgi:hypothetical protein
MRRYLRASATLVVLKDNGQTKGGWERINYPGASNTGKKLKKKYKLLNKWKALSFWRFSMVSLSLLVT